MISQTDCTYVKAHAIPISFPSSSPSLLFPSFDPVSSIPAFHSYIPPHTSQRTAPNRFAPLALKSLICPRR